VAAIWNFVTDFGDSAVTAPLALLTLVFLVIGGSSRVARDWAWSVGGCAVAIGALKLAFAACGARNSLAGICSPSGHTAMSTAVYGSLALLIGARLAPARRSLLYGAAAIAIVVIGLSRVALDNHTPAEVVLGFVVGAAAITPFRAGLAGHPAPALPLGWLLLCAGGLIALMHGTRWIVEPAVHRLAWDFRVVLPWCR
jgi:membrane-associated phospholipid phosphatase